MKSKAKFVKAGLNTKKVVDLSSREERFKALENKTFQEIRQLEKDLNIDLWDKNYLNKIEQGFTIKDKKLPVDLKYSDMTLSDAAKLKKIMLDGDNASNEVDSPILTYFLSFFNGKLNNENKDPEKTNKNKPSKGNS